uniref:Uncharacterized protein LOC111121915 n=1 Tax=Crassostrea virginica TaxID=6565 RepID=A0A8B8CX95_CRAVI|nr:uncharacterized protein LOC111121915 [Crassostrea virginica]
MMLFLVLTAGLLVNLANGVDNSKQEVTLPCDFDSYDTNKDGTVTSAEFLAVSHGFTKVRPDAIFARIDTNHDHQIDHDEFLKAMPELRRDHVFGHCKKICICYRYICYCLRPAKQAPKVVFKG